MITPHGQFNLYNLCFSFLEGKNIVFFPFQKEMRIFATESRNLHISNISVISYRSLSFISAKWLS